MLYYQDVRGPKDATGQFTAPDGKITDADMDYLTRKSSNHYSIGFNFTTSYKNFSLAAVIGGSFGGQGMVEGTARSQGTLTANRPVFWADHWTPDNPNAAYPNPYYKDTYTVDSQFWFASSTQLAVRNFNLSYALPSAIAGKLRMSSVRAYLVATNPLNLYNPYSWKSYSGNYDAYPMLRSFSLGLNLGL